MSVLVSDAHPLYREALERTIKSWPEFALLTAHPGETLYQALGRAEPCVLVIDPATAGVDRAQLLDSAPDSTRILIITGKPVPGEIYTALANGAAGYLGKDCPAREVCDAIAAVARGEEILGASVQPVLASEIRLRATSPRDFLTAREREILLLIADGLSAPEIGRKLHIGTATVKTHQHHIYERLGARERAEAVAEAMRRGLIE